MSSKTILLADNLPELLKTRKEFLEMAGYKVVLANNPESAQNILDRGGIDLAILDIRLIDDSDDQDTSGLELAKKTDLSIPIIMLTGYPSWQLVRESLGPSIKGIPPAIDFICKQDGPEAMVRAVNMTLERPFLRENVLVALNVKSTLALQEQMESLGPQRTALLLRESFRHTSNELSKSREQANKQASRLHAWALRMAVLGMGVILAGVILTFINSEIHINSAAISALILDAVSFLFFRERT